MLLGRLVTSSRCTNLTGKVAKNLGCIFAETLLSSTKKKDTILDKISVHGTENLDNALSCGKGVMAVSAHLGNFSLLWMLKCSARVIRSPCW